MKKMSRQKVCYAAAAETAYLGGFFLILLCAAGEKLGLSLHAAGKIGAGAGGVLLMLAGIAAVVQYLNCLVAEDEELKISETDERNVMIRGKAAQNALLTVNILLLVVLLLICLQEAVATLLITAVLILENLIQMGFINYYEKKY